jgi:hypothetical protein
LIVHNKNKKTTYSGAPGTPFTQAHKNLSEARQFALPNMRLALRIIFPVPPGGSFPEDSRSLID